MDGDDDDRQRFISLLKTVVDRYGWCCQAYCLTDNHYHLLIETNRASLSGGMKLLNGSYAQQLNRQYQRIVHVFQGRFKAMLLCICLAILTRKSGIFLLGCGVCSSFAFLTVR
jgi:REP element-mobilizing transposase RayT